MSATVFAFPHRKTGPQPWTNDELAELYRVVDILARAGLAVETDMGMSDEGDPWFVFCRADTGDVIAHFARIDGQFVAASVAVDETYKGANFRQIVDQMVQRQPLILPPPSRGTRLLLHPAVILTAFVATALAHSEKAMAADSMRPVEAKWDHHPADGTVDGHAKTVKPSWFDSLQSMLKGAPGDGKHGHESDSLSGAAHGISLASLIAIAMSAMQPLVEKLSVITESAVAGLEGHSHDAPAATAHSDKLAAMGDLPIIEQSAIKGDGSIVLKTDGHDQPAAPKKDVVDTGPTDQQKMIADSHASSPQPAAQKAAVAEDAPHKAMPLDTPPDVAAVPLSQQKFASTSAVTVTDSVHTDSSDATPTFISVNDISNQALQVLKLHFDPSAPTGDLGQNNPIITTTDLGKASAPDSTPALPAQQILPASTNAVDVLHAIANFVESGQYNFATPLATTTNLQSALANYADNSHSVKIVVFESTNPTPDIFQFSPGVVFVDEKYFTQNQALTSSTSHLVVDIAGGGSVTLVGVTTVNHLPAVTA